MFSKIRIVSLSLMLTIASVAVTRGAEKDDAAFAKAPAKVQAAAKKALGDKKLAEFGKESIGEKIIYEVGFKVDGVDHAYVFSETGELIQEEADIEVAKLPTVVAKAIKRAQPEGKIAEAATGTAGDKHFYVIEVKVAKDTHAIQVSEEGKVLADEIVKVLSMDEKAK